MFCVTWDICLEENIGLCTLIPVYTLVIKKNYFELQRKIGKDLSVILKHGAFQRSIISLENFLYKDVLKDITS